jgi:hypothetical protein
MKGRLLLWLAGLALVLTTLLDAPKTALASQTCTSNADCPPGTLCCYPCGIDGCQNMCIQPFRGGCPHFP